MRFAFLWHKVFDLRAGVNLCVQIERLGHTTAYFQDVTHRNKEVLSHFDVVMEVGRARDDDIPKSCIHICWVQEFFGYGDPRYENALDHDLIYTFGDPAVIGCPKFKQWAGSLVMAVDPSFLDIPLPTEQDIDLSLAGFIAPLIWFFPTEPLDTERFKQKKFGLSREATDLVTSTTRLEPLTGTFDQLEEFERYRRALRQMFADNGWETNAEGWAEYDEYGAQTVHQWARFLNRIAAASLMLAVSENVVFQGKNWHLFRQKPSTLTVSDLRSLIPEFARWARPFTDDESELRRLYRRSKINVHDNIFGFAMHSRVLEVMASGGFVMAHKSAHRGKAGQITETFDPGVDFGEYTADDFIERAKFWLSDGEARRWCTENTRDVIREKHLWEHRARQVLADLGA